MYETIVDMWIGLSGKENIHSPVAVCKVPSGAAHSKILYAKNDALAEWPAKERSPGELFMQRYIMPKGRKA
jgi:hypothetical protein